MGNEPGLCDDVDVGGQRERHDVGLEAVDHVLGLGRGAAVGLLEDYRLVVVLLLPLRLEGGDDLAVDLARRAVGGEGDDRCHRRLTGSVPGGGAGTASAPTAAGGGDQRGRARQRHRPVDQALSCHGCSSPFDPTGESLPPAPSVSGGPVDRKGCLPKAASCDWLPSIPPRPAGPPTAASWTSRSRPPDPRGS